MRRVLAPYRLREILRAEGVSFQRLKTWKHSRDPDYAVKKARIEHLSAFADGSGQESSRRKAGRAPTAVPAQELCRVRVAPVPMVAAGGYVPRMLASPATATRTDGHQGRRWRMDAQQPDGDTSWRPATERSPAHRRLDRHRSGRPGGPRVITLGQARLVLHVQPVCTLDARPPWGPPMWLGGPLRGGPSFLSGTAAALLWLARHAAILVNVDVGIIRLGAPPGAWDDTWRQQLQAVKEALDLC